MRVTGDGGVAVYEEVAGPVDGPPVMFLHGVTASARTWAWLPDEIARGRRVVLVDLRGHERSDHAPGSYESTATAPTW